MVYQDEKSNCGEFALRNLLRIISRSKAYYFIPLSKEITSFYDMKEELVALGYEVKCYNYLDVDSLKKKKVYIEQFKGKEEDHFVVIKKTIFNNIFKVIDSGKGKYYLTKKGIKNKSNRNVLVIEKDAPEHIYLDVINKKDKLVYSLIVFFEYLSFLLLYFKGFTKNYLFYIFITLIFLFSYMDKSFLARMSNKIDREKIASYLDDYEEEEFKFLNDFKASYLKEINLKISGLFLLLSLLITSVYVDLKYLFLLILISIFTIFFDKVFDLKLSNIESDIYKKEISMKENKKLDESVFEESKKYSLIYNFKTIILFMMCFIFAFFISKGNEIETLFLMFLSFYLSNKIIEFKSFYRSSNSSLKMLRNSRKNIKNNSFFKRK